MTAAAAAKRVHAVVRGRVQGVGYRARAAHEARRLELVGWVRNCADGSVELEAQGTSDAIAELLAWCRRGPQLARVTEVATTELEPLADAAGERDFDVRR